MCGLVAILAYNPDAPAVDGNEILAMREAMAARGPDGEGLWRADDGRVGLGHRRLAIIDPEPRGAQPMASADGARRIVFNGEIYNHAALRAELEGEGHAFRTACDTEVLLQLYARDGAAMVERLRGMYAFALWDGARGGLLLARDPLGIKPLYVADDGRTLRAASQVKALTAGRAVDTAPEAAGHAGFFLFGYVPEPYTLHRGIRAFPAGATQWIDADGRQPPRRYFSLPTAFAAARPEAPQDRAAMRERLRAALADSVAHHLVADIPVGVFLSAGLDSTTVTALAAEARGGGLDTFTLAFDEFRGGALDEAPLAETVAGQYGTRHRTRHARGAAFHDELSALLAAMDQPSIDGANTYMVAKAAAEGGLKVALSGLGGDELFGGYPSFRQVPRLVRALAATAAVPALGRGLRRLAAPLAGRITSPKYAGLVEYGASIGDAYLLRRALYMPWEIPRILDPDLARDGLAELAPRERLATDIKGIGDPVMAVAALEMGWYMRNQLLRDADWAGMAHGLEIRTPLVDAALLRELLPLLAARPRPDKLDMASAARPPLPPAVLERRKTGFVVPIREWLQQRPGEAGATGERGLRGWARRLYREGGFEP